MTTLARQSFARGWTPSADAVGAPADACLRMDNLVLDERGVLGLRRGSAKINSVAFADTDVHSLFTATLSGTRYRMSGAAAAVYANGTSIASGTAGSNDIAFGSALGHILWARSTTKKKYDGTTVRNWGIAAPSAAPTAAARTPDSKTFASFNSSETADWTMNEDDGTGNTFTAGFDGTANGALIVNPDETTTRGIATKAFGSDQNFTSYDAAQVGIDDDLISLWMYVTEPAYWKSLNVVVDCNDGTFELDSFAARWSNPALEPPSTAAWVIDFTPQTGWNHLSLRRGDWLRSGAGTSGKGWATVRAVRVIVQATVGSTAAQARFDLMKITGGAQYPLTGTKEYVVVAVRNDGNYTAKSGPSASVSVDLTAQGAAITVTGAVIAALDSQVNELWLYRRGGNLPEYYRVAVKDDDPFSGDEVINDELSDEDALIANLRLEPYNTTPPDSIIGIAGPLYDRTFALTATHLYPSQPRNPDSFDSRHPVRVGDNSETALWVVKVREELYVGTTKDIYRCEGDWTLLNDFTTLNVTKRPLGVAHPPISSAIAQDGDTVIYLAADGWRQLGAEAPFTTGDVDLLYQGYTRHGVSPVNLSTGRFKAALTKGWFTALTPEGASTTSSTVLHRYVPTTQRWYRHSYSRSWRCVYREPDGTLIASDNAGFVWTLDTGTQDDGSNLAVVLWTPIEDNGQPNQRKDGWDLRVRANTGGATATVALHLDGSGSSSTSMSVASSGLTAVAASLSSLSAYIQSQLRVTGSFATFLWYDYTLTYRERPALLVYAEPKPEVRGTRRKRFAGLSVILDTLNAAATVTPVVDDTDQSGQSVTTNDARSTALTFSSVVGRDLWAKISKATGFEFYGLEPNVIAELPPIFQGRVPDNTFGTPRPKVITGIRVRACTLAAERTFTVILDGESQATTFAFTTGADEPDEYVHSFSEPLTATDLAFSVDGQIELYDWAPLVDHVLPLGRTLWDTGPMELGSRAAWVTHLELKAKLTGTLTVTPYIDDVAQTAVTVSAPSDDPITTHTIPLARTVRGRVVRVRLSSADTFHPYWLKPKYRLTGHATDLRANVMAEASA